MALYEFHGEELHAVGIAQVVDADYILASNLLREKKLLLESGDNRRVGGQVGTDQLLGDEAVEFAVIGFINRAHSAFLVKCKIA